MALTFRLNGGLTGLDWARAKWGRFASWYIKGGEKNAVKYGCFVGYDDSPRRGHKGKAIVDASAEKFQKYLRQLIKICESQNKEYIFLTAWNEWGEGAHLEPDSVNEYSYLEAYKKARS